MAQETTANVNSQRQVRDVATGIFMLQPSAAPMLHLLKLKTRKVGSIKPEWESMTLPAVEDTLAVAALINDTAVTVADGTKFIPSTVVRFPNLALGARNYVVTAVVGNVLTLNSGLSGGLAIADPIQILSNAQEEGEGLPKAQNRQPVFDYNYLQIFEKYVNISNTANAINLFGTGKSGELDLQVKQAGIDYLRQIEKAFLFGERIATTGPNGAPLRLTGGLTAYLNQNVVAVNGVLTESVFQDWLRAIYKYPHSGKNKIALCSPFVKQVITNFAATQIRTDRTKTSIIGFTVDTYEGGAGSIDLVVDPLLDNTNDSGTLFGLDLVDLTRLILRPTVLEPVAIPGVDGKGKKFISEQGLQVVNSPHHGMLTGITG